MNNHKYSVHQSQLVHVKCLPVTYRFLNIQFLCFHERRQIGSGTMYQNPAQQTGIQGPPNQQPVGYPQGHGPPAQPIMYQMPPGQPQPVFTGQPVMGQQGQPMQYFAPAGQPIQPAPGPTAQPPLNQDEDVTTIRLNKVYIKSGLGCSRVMEFVSILRILSSDQLKCCTIAVNLTGYSQKCVKRQ